MAITDLALSYNDFQLDTIINPDEFDANFGDIVTKINELIADLNTAFVTARIANDAITSDKIADGAVLPAHVGNFTIEEAEPTVSTAALSVLINNLAERLSDIKGAGQVWTTDAVIDLIQTKAHVDAASPHSGHETPSGAQAKVDTHANRTDNPHSVTATQVGAITGLNNVSNPGGAITIQGGTGITITTDDASNRVTITATGEVQEQVLNHVHDDSDINITDANSNFTAETLDGVLDELFTSVSNGKGDIATAITGKGGTASGSDTFAELASAIDGITQGSGDATDADVLATKTYSNDGGSSIGTMVNNGACDITPGTSNITIPQGYHSGAGVVYGDSDLIAANIKNGVNIFGVTGTLGGATIKSIQTGVVNSASAVQTITITGVDMAKSMVFMSYYESDSSAASHTDFWGIYLYSTTQIKISTADYDTNANFYIRWYVVEFDTGVTVQRGQMMFDDGASTLTTQTAMITSVDTAKSFITVSNRAGLYQDAVKECFFRADITNATTITLTRGAGYTGGDGNAAYGYWEVITYA